MTIPPGRALAGLQDSRTLAMRPDALQRQPSYQSLDIVTPRPRAPRPSRQLTGPYPLDDANFLNPSFDYLPQNPASSGGLNQYARPTNTEDVDGSVISRSARTRQRPGETAPRHIQVSEVLAGVKGTAQGQSAQSTSAANIDTVVRLVLSGKTFFLSKEQIDFDSPNGINQFMEHVRDKAIEAAAGLPTGPRSPSDFGRFGVSVIIPERNPFIFETILLPYLSGVEIFPLNSKAKRALVHCCKPGEDFFDVLHAEACVWGLNQLQARVLQEKESPPRECGLDEREANMKRTARELVTRMRLQRQLSRTSIEDEDTEDVMKLLHIPKHQLDGQQMSLVRRFYTSHRRVEAWKEALQREPPPAGPSNSTYMAARGWRVGVMYYRSNAIHHAPVIPDEDIEEKEFIRESDCDSVPGRRRSRGLVYLLKGDAKKDNVSDAKKDNVSEVLSFARQSVARYSSTNFQEIMQQSRRLGGLFHSCMQNAIGRHGLEVVYKTSLILAFQNPLLVLSDLLIIGYYRRGSLKVTSHPSELMSRVLAENRWTAPLPYVLDDEDFINEEEDVRIAFSPSNLKKVWYLPY